MVAGPLAGLGSTLAALPALTRRASSGFPGVVRGAGAKRGDSGDLKKNGERVSGQKNARKYNAINIEKNIEPSEMH